MSSSERDPELERWFDATEEHLIDETFTTGVMARIAARRRRVLTTRFGILALVVMLELLLDAPLGASVGMLSNVLATNLYPVENEWLEFVVSPVNSVAGVLGLILLALHLFYRRYAR